jgi:hypothetical protein
VGISTSRRIRRFTYSRPCSLVANFTQHACRNRKANSSLCTRTNSLSALDSPAVIGPIGDLVSNNDAGTFSRCVRNSTDPGCSAISRSNSSMSGLKIGTSLTMAVLR